MNYIELDYEYYDDGSGATVGITTVWILEENKTVYVYCNDEGCSIMSVDFLRYNLSTIDYSVNVMLDDLPFEDFNDECRHNKYLPLYRNCMERYIVDYCHNCPDEDGTIEVPYEILSYELQEQIAVRDKDYYVTNGREIL